MSVGEIPDSGPLIIGHRGASAHAPENTHAAFERAFADGADGIEFDVRLASDGVPFVFHDATFKRTAMIDGDADEHPSTDLSQIWAGAWFNKRYPERAHPTFIFQHIPTLAQVFGRYGARTLYAEMKCEDASRRAALAGAVVATTRAFGIADRVVVKSFEHDALTEVKRLAPEIRTAALFGRSWPRPLLPGADIIAAAERCGANEISLHHSLLRKATVEEARRRGFEVLVWTVNSPFWLRRARSLGVRAVFTDRPGRMRDYLSKKLRARGGAGRRQTA